MTSDDQVNAALEREAEFDRLELEVGASTAPYLRATTAERDRRVLAAEVRRLRGELQDERLSLAPLREAHAEALNAAAQNEAALAALRERHAADVEAAYREGHRDAVDHYEIVDPVLRGRTRTGSSPTPERRWRVTSDDLLTTVKAWLAKVVPCPKCGGDGVVAVYSSHAEHDPGCDGSCRNCPVEVQDCEQGPCDCVFAQAAITEADYQQVCIWLRALVARCEAAEAENAELRKGRIPSSWLAMHAADKRLYEAARAEAARLRELLRQVVADGIDDYWRTTDDGVVWLDWVRELTKEPRRVEGEV